MIYLASPYSHPDPAVREQRFRAACRAAVALLRAVQVVFSPITHSHPLAQHGLPGNWQFWERYDRAFLERCDEVVVLMLDGWGESVGVQAEIRIAWELGKPVRYLAPELAPVSPTLAHVASGSPEADPTPIGADRPPTLAHVASEVPG
jgi:nucleoside 2-deoxyribosyltransferase